MARNTDHVVARTDGAPGTMPIECLRCGAKIALTLPVSVDEFSAATKAFVARHADCVQKGGGGGA